MNTPDTNRKIALAVVITAVIVGGITYALSRQPNDSGDTGDVNYEQRSNESPADQTPSSAVPATPSTETTKPEAEKPAEQAKIKTYTNSVNRFALDYPASDTLTIASDTYAFIKDKISVFYYKDTERRASFDAYMKERALASCGADGPTGSIQCARYEKNPEAFKTTSGLTGYKIVMEEEHTSFNSEGKKISYTETRTVYAIQLSGNGQIHEIVLVEPMSEGLSDMAKTIAISVRKD